MAVDVFENPYQGRDYRVKIRWPESEDFDEVKENSLPGVLFIDYIPDRYCLNRESLANYLKEFAGSDFLDQRTLNLLLTDLVNSSKPRQMDISYAHESERSSKTVVSRSYKRSDIRVEE